MKTEYFIRAFGVYNIEMLLIYNVTFMIHANVFLEVAVEGATAP